MRKMIGYAKLGRSMELKLEKCGSLGGDNEMVPTLKLLADRHPEHDFIIVGRNSGELPRDVGLPSNVYNPWHHVWPRVRRSINDAGLNYSNLSIDDHLRLRDLMWEHVQPMFEPLDHMIMWIGQHGTSNMPLPSIKDRNVLTKPYDWANLYGGYLLHAINRWRDADPINREPVLLNADARNYPKWRDSKHSFFYPVLGQHNEATKMKHEQFNENGVDTSIVTTRYVRLEISSLLPGTPFGDTIQFSDQWSGRHAFGIVFNETRKEVPYDRSRKKALKEWVLPLEPRFIHGTWSQKTMDELRTYPTPLSLLEYIPKIQSVHSTLTTPASGSGWATAKPWEAFAAGVVCFFHPLYDTQDNILGDADPDLRNFLRVGDVATLRRRIKMVHEDVEIFHWAIEAQRAHFENACRNLDYLRLIEERLGL